MRALLLSVLLVATVAFVRADVPIPYKNCGGPNDHVKVIAATASSWPVKVGQATLFTIEAALNEQLNGGSYHLTVSLGGWPIMDKKGSLQDLDPSIQWPIDAGVYNTTQNVTIPSIVPSGTQVGIKLSANDLKGESLTCIQLDVKVGVSTEWEKESDSDIAESIFGEATEASNIMAREFESAIRRWMSEADGVMTPSNKADSEANNPVADH